MTSSSRESKKGTKVTRMKAEDRRQRILDAAIHVFASENYQGATTAKIAEAAGITEPVIYQHFKSKGELFLEVIRISRRKMIEWNAEVLASHENPITRYHAFTDMFMHYTTQLNRDVVLLWSIAFHVNDPEVRAEIHDTEEELLKQLTDDLRGSMEEGKISSRHAPEVLATIIYSIHGQLTWLALVGAFYFQDWVYQDIKRCVDDLLTDEPRIIPPLSKVLEQDT